MDISVEETLDYFDELFSEDEFFVVAKPSASGSTVLCARKWLRPFVKTRSLCANANTALVEAYDSYPIDKDYDAVDRSDFAVVMPTKTSASDKGRKMYRISAMNSNSRSSYTLEYRYKLYLSIESADVDEELVQIEAANPIARITTEMLNLQLALTQAVDDVKQPTVEEVIETAEYQIQPNKEPNRVQEATAILG
ncbi:uncharacterized protein MYCFIDRAFT_199576 [Pseudocercospora fijiensis CIRAD86]|uniref:Uncharacterized protein n=1 Tax=Pseudocercospora fijiensis (strain CIRAD86) TaxID=383855 RepID=M2YKU8_PSEFD|nr:uncharacterized protein MYCFIDRAFT_199576 [Pseudocercospora fijiensis CIRAD86]EME78350.1 hypothetical protein MYCFIDRAFT_199576 [Pseudocercospora fijiensis CIRAD86]